ncbi:flagellar hook-associated protein FlgL [Thermosulfurimonas sp.]|uniref:flagellar hook-associated protein FlgL n=1 Tax=Thermosulfurimonas sp. TaxID=2080236 RepID=UPI0025E8FD8C|nr:flagellar hook-associated protein FlgL [Thermosulfurimonas sp.]
MRLSMRTLYGGLLTDLEHLTESMYKYQTQIATGKKFQRPSDAPVELNYALGYRKALAEIDRYQESIREATSFLKTAEGALKGLKKVIERAKELALKGANDIQNASTRKAMAAELDGLIQEALSLANTQDGDRYVFAGNRPTGYQEGEKPFELVKKVLPDGQVVEQVVYKGGAENLYLGYARGSKILVGRNGEEALMASDLFSALIALRNTLANDNVADPRQEVEDIQTQIGRLDKVLNHILEERSAVGTRLDHLELKKNLYQDFHDILIGNLGEVEEVDYLEAVTKLNAKRTAYEAALKAATQTMGLSLVNFL